MRSILLADGCSTDARIFRTCVPPDVLVREARDGREALRVLEEWPAGTHPDLVVLAYRLPRLSGPDLVRAVRRRVAAGEAPVIVLTPVPDEAAEAAARTAGADEVFAKPIAREEFASRARAILRRWLSSG